MMEPTPEFLEQLSSVLVGSYSPDKQTRDNATQYLMNESGTQGLSNCLLTLAADDNQPLEIRQSAAVNLNTLIQRSWAPKADSQYPPIPTLDKDMLKTHLVEVMVNVPSLVFKPLSAALQMISAHEFPHDWPELMPVLVQKLRTDDPNVVIMILKTLNAVFKFYRGKVSSQYVPDLVKIMASFGAPMNELFGLYTEQFDQMQDNEEAVRLLLTIIRLFFEIFYSLTNIDIPQIFVDNLDTWMLQFQKYLRYSSTYPSLLPPPDEDTIPQPGLITKTQASVLKVLNMFVRKFDEDCEQYTGTFLNDVSVLLNDLSAVPPESQLHYDQLVIEALGFLNAVITGPQHNLFNGEGMLDGLSASIVAPNIVISSRDEEMFEYDHLEYIRSDLEGNDSLTRKRSAVDLVKGIRRYYESTVTQIITDMVVSLLAQYESDPENNWRQKDQAIYLVIALAATSSSNTKGVITVNSMVPLNDFFTVNIMPELEEINFMEMRPIVKADCLRFIISFRRHLPAEYFDRIISVCANYLAHSSPVVATYAAIALEGVITMRDGHEYRVSPQIVVPHLELILNNLFNLINVDKTKFTSENPYAGSCLSKIISIFGSNLIGQATSYLDRLTTKLGEIYKNATSQLFVHHIFDSIAAILSVLIKGGQAELAFTAEQQLLPMFETILAEDIIDLIPYVFQLMAQLIEAHKSDPATLITRYGEQLPQFLNHQHWERFANIPALTRLVSTYIRYAPDFIVQGNHLVPILIVYKRLNNLKGNERYGFRLLLDILLSLDSSIWQNELRAIFDLILSRIKHAKTPVYINWFIVFISNLCYSQLGPEFVINAFNKVSPGVFKLLLRDIIIPSLTSTNEFKTVSVGMTILATSNVMVEHCSEYFVPLISSIIGLIVGISVDENELKLDDKSLADVLSDNSGPTASHSYVHLDSTGGKSDEFLVPNQIVPLQFFAEKLVEFNSSVPNGISSMLANLNPEAQSALNQILSTAGVSIQ